MLHVFSLPVYGIGNPWLPIIVYDLVDEQLIPINTFPQADEYTINWNDEGEFNVLVNDPSDEGYGIEIISSPLHGSIEIVNDVIRYTVTEEYIGVDSFKYRLISGDVGKRSDVATVNITIEDIDRGLPPVAVDNLLTTTGNNRIVHLDVVANDTDVDSKKLTIKSITNPAYGVSEIFGDGSIGYTPTDGYCDNDSFTYIVQDEFANESEAIVSIQCDNSYVPPPSIPKILVPEIKVNSPLSLQQVYSVVDAEFASDEKYELKDLMLVLDNPNTDGLAVPEDLLQNILASRQGITTTHGIASVINVLGGRYPIPTRVIFYTMPKLQMALD